MDLKKNGVVSLGTKRLMPLCGNFIKNVCIPPPNLLKSEENYLKLQSGLCVGEDYNYNFV